MTGSWHDVDLVLPVGMEVETVEDQREGRLDRLYRVVGVQGVVREVRTVQAATGALKGARMRFPAPELRPARPTVLRRYEALRARRVLASWRQAAATDVEDFHIVEELLASAERLAALVLDTGTGYQDDAVAVCGFVSSLDGAHAVQIDTTAATGRVRVMINDGSIYDGDPETDAPPGAHYQDAGGQRCVSEVEVREVVNAVADEVLAVAGEPESGVRDAINLVVNGALHRLFANRDAELAEIVAASYSSEVTMEEVAAWITS